MAQVSLTLEIHRKWWVIPSTHVLAALCRATGYAPNLDKLASWYANYGFELIVDGKRTRLGAL